MSAATGPIVELESSRDRLLFWGWGARVIENGQHVFGSWVWGFTREGAERKAARGYDRIRRQRLSVMRREVRRRGTVERKVAR